MNLTEENIGAILHSDMKLWDSAESESVGEGKVKKTLVLPYGIGKTEVTLEGLTDGNKRRQALGQYGDYIRGVIKDRTSDDAVESRAKQAAARARPEDSDDSLREYALRAEEKEHQTEAIQSTEEAHEATAKGVIEFGEALVAQRDGLALRIRRTEDVLAKQRLEYRALAAACEAMEEESCTPE
jgi:hypothetical protein